MDGIKNNKTWFTILLVLLNLALLFSIWYPRLKTTETVAVKKETPRQGRINTGYWNQIEYYLREELKFTEEQVERFKQLQSEHLVRAKALRDKNHKIRNEIMTLLFDDNPNKSEVEKLSHDLGVMHEKLEKEIFFHFMDLMAACQPDQRANFKQLLQKVFERQRPPEPPPGHRPRQHPPGDGHPGQGLPGQGHPGENGLENRRPTPGKDGTQGQARPGQQGREDLNVPGRDSQDRQDRPGEQGEPRGFIVNDIDERLKRDVAALKQNLNLTAQQAKQVEEILTKFHKLEREQGRSRNLKEETDRAIENILTPTQQELFRKFLEETRHQHPGSRPPRRNPESA